MLPDWLLRAAAKQPAPNRSERRSVAIAGRDLPLSIRRLRTARRMTLRLAPDGSEARITLPPWGRIDDAEGFARDRADWLAAQLAHATAPQPPGAGGTLLYRGHELVIDWQAKAPRRPVVLDGAVVVGGPGEGLAGRLRRWLQAEALRLCGEDLAHYAAKSGVATPALRLSSATRRWGSCATCGTIRINWRLVMAPDAVRQSVVAHEVAHLTHFDHSPAFHAHAAALFEGDLPAANLWLKREGRRLYASFG